VIPDPEDRFAQDIEIDWTTTETRALRRSREPERLREPYDLILADRIPGR